MTVILQRLRGSWSIYSHTMGKIATATFSSKASEVSLEDAGDKPLMDMENPFRREKMQCILCRHKVKVDYKNVKLLSQFVSPYTGRIYGRHITRLCSTQQKKVEQEIIKSQNAGLMAWYLKGVEFVHDPQLFSPEQPIRPHRF
ncbi:small ribosomal subunit protein bS18m [Anabrus simplex]|uniref:small ribosomal subunit protein bS18m n=1 Tax=Anabrus simplex TaxID=316456 RepID=UPI0034DD752D